MVAIWMGCFDFLTMINIILIMQMFFGMGFFEKSWNKYIFVGVFVLGHILMYTVFAENEVMQFLINYGYLGATVLYLSSKRRIRTIFLMIPGILIYVEWSFLVGMIKDILPWRFITVSGSSLSVFELIMDLLLAVGLHLGIRWCQKKSRFVTIHAGEMIFLCLFCLISPIFIEILELLIETNQNTFRQVVWTLFVAAVNALVFYAVLHRGNAQHYKEVSENYKEQFGEEYIYFKQYKKEQQDIIRFRHDWKNHLQVITALFEKGDYEKARDYFSDLAEGMNRADKTAKALTGNEIVDIILAAKAEQIEEAEIKIECNGGLECMYFMEAVDCCILFANLIDNAIEANMACDSGRFLCLKSTIRTAHMIISVENPMMGNLTYTEDGLATTKDGKYHGIGTGNIFEIIEKYNGEYEIDEEDNTFFIRMLFPIC